jgi:penicillin amidase
MSARSSLVRAAACLIAFAALACGSKSTSPTPTVDAATSDVVTPAGDATATDASATDAAGDATTVTDPKQKAILGVPQKESWQIGGLSAPVQVLRTEGNRAHIYASNRKDLARIQGFVLARDRLFQMELTRRFGLGTISELLGDKALAQDIRARQSGGPTVAQAIEARLTPEEAAVFDAFAAGINDAIAQMVAGKLPLPTEIQLFAPVLQKQPKDLLQPWNRSSVAGAAAAIVYNLGYETDDVGRTANLQKAATQFKDKPLGELRTAGALKDIQKLVAPIKPVSSAAGLGLDLNGKAVAKTEPGKKPAGKPAWQVQQLPAELIERAIEMDQRWQKHSGHDRTDGFGSNAWATVGAASPEGAAILAGDGHLPLSVPSLFYQMGADDRVFGGDDVEGQGKSTHQMGLYIPGLPMMAVGTNGRVAWSQTQLVGDITDWYREEVKLDANGLPVATVFQGKDQPLAKFDESFVIANVPVLGSKGRTEKWARWVTANGQWLTDVEGPAVDPATYKPAKGEAIVALGGKFVVPKDTDGDGKITGIAFDFTGLDQPAIMHALEGFGHANDVYQFRDWTRWLVAYSQNIVVADADGHAFYTGYQAVPCRKHLPRDKDGQWLPGADPKQLIDGALYGGFTIPTLADGRVDEGQSADPSRCVVPFDEYPQSIDPAQGFVLTGNNDPGNLSTDNSLTNDKWYIGGPWANGYRAQAISDGLAALAKAKTADVAGHAAVQALHFSSLGRDWLPKLQQVVGEAKALAQGMGPKALTAEEQRVVDLFQAATAVGRDEALARLDAWLLAGAQAESGVATFYHGLGTDEPKHAVATSLFNAWMGRFVELVLDDEQINLWEPWGNDGRSRAITFLWAGRGANNPLQQASWNPATQESAFFDVLDTPVVESGRELMLKALNLALADLAKAYSSSDQATWLWGLRHGVHFDSLLGSFLDQGSDFASLIEQFSITPATPGMDLGKALAKLTQFPRPGDAFAVDACGGIDNHGYGSGPVFRMVIALTPGKTWGQNILPGGQSGLTDSPHFADQAKLWLGNQAWPLRFEVEDVVAGAIGREVYTP